MSKTQFIVNIDSNLKKEAEEILDEFEISPSLAISEFYKQIVLNNGIPFDLNEAQIDKENYGRY